MRAPDFWRSDGILPTLLAPAAAIYGAAGALRRRRARPWRAPVPVVCIGNLVAGGAGKTPVARSVCARLTERGLVCHLLSRGYGGTEKGPLRVDPQRHTARDVGDEALLLAQTAPAWIARDRAAGAKAAADAGAGAIVLDDGFQNPSLAKDVSLLVVDGGYAFGNRRLIPAGPLREPIADGMSRADAVVVIGQDTGQVSEQVPAHLPILRARLIAGGGSSDVAGKPVIAFAGIGRPEKFFETLENLQCDLRGRHPFADHHMYSDHEIMILADKADKLKAQLVTTAKDFVRLPEHLQALVAVIEVDLQWDSADNLDRLLEPVLTND